MPQLAQYAIPLGVNAFVRSFVPSSLLADPQYRQAITAAGIARRVYSRVVHCRRKHSGRCARQRRSFQPASFVCLLVCLRLRLQGLRLQRRSIATDGLSRTRTDHLPAGPMAQRSAHLRCRWLSLALTQCLAWARWTRAICTVIRAWIRPACRMTAISARSGALRRELLSL